MINIRKNQVLVLMLLAAMIAAVGACTVNAPANDNTQVIPNNNPPPATNTNQAAQQPPPATTNTTPPIQTTGGNAKYRIIYINASQNTKYTPNRIQVDQYDLVRIYVTSLDAAAGFSMYDDVYSFNEVIPAGETRMIEFNATKAGIFTFKCSAACHPVSFSGTLVVLGHNTGPVIQE